METAIDVSSSSRVPASLRGILPVLIALPVLLVLELLLRDSQFTSYLLCVMGVNVLLAVSLNIVNGMTGQFSIGHAGFMAVGAYIAGITSLALKDVAISFLPVAVSDQVLLLVALLVAGAAAALAGFLVGLPSLRLRGDYLAIVTLGFGEIIRVVVTNTQAFGRALGLTGIPQTSSVAMVGLWVFLGVLVARRIAGSSHGRSLLAIREDEVAAEAMGVNTTGYKVRAFVVSSFFAGVAGGLFAHFVPIINPGSFTFVKSMEVVVMVVLGGLGSTTGAIVAAVFLTLLPEAMRSAFSLVGPESNLAQQVDQIRMPIYGLLLVVLMLARPQGLLGSKELWDVVPRWLPRRRKGM
ncbi:branched-chain amino acid ABC transporter permease [Cystobacter ferrugineus]|uniref:Branched-chain amino acid ABC transporter permease n=2 Tax=Cystobacter TaxID=42 RepID=A0A1L9BJD0_9BACT|nr:branched-chain amino acid ABC transporter permease [Cystobacter ferrugineus]AYM53333.1 branched chain amino acid ABC transporter permease [Cystobacter ferrugineus]AYM53404.1 branched chain amino acid ABC transporter permease [Cystobacter velatus]OJH42306.1 branched-chain amino acid ABC transporter permease [Cystobacter ferrugineus]